MKEKIAHKGSLWADTAGNVAPARTLAGDISTDVLVVGGGMAGILIARRLKDAGVDCVIVEGNQAGAGITRNTTAKITAQHGLIYDGLNRTLGREKAGLYYALQMRALEAYSALSKDIPCDMEEKTAFVYSTRDTGLIDREASAYAALGIPYTYQEAPPIPVQVKGALGMMGQAQFHPLKLLHGLKEDIDIYENTYVEEIRGNTAITKNGRIRAEHIVLATHFPLVNIPGLYFMKLYQHRSYVLALEGGPNIEGMYVDEREKGHSFRNYKEYLLIGGGDHKTGCQGGGYTELKALAKKAYPEQPVRYAWATQDCMSLDGLPYIGLHRAGAKRLYVATGFNKWGMTGSMAAAILLTDLITEQRSAYTDLLSPRRSILKGQLFVNMGSAIGNLLRFGKRCTHMGCALKWNRQERTWDCPCHGSRFDEYGNILDNPAKRELKLD